MKTPLRQLENQQAVKLTSKAFNRIRLSPSRQTSIAIKIFDNLDFNIGPHVGIATKDRSRAFFGENSAQ